MAMKIRLARGGFSSGGGLLGLLVGAPAEEVAPAEAEEATADEATADEAPAEEAPAEEAAAEDETTGS